MSAPPKTILHASPQEERAIRDAVRHIDVATLGPGRVLATAQHAGGVLDLFADPAVSGPIYALPHPLSEASVAAWIAQASAARQRGEALLILTAPPGGMIMGYSKVTLWPERSSAELGGALRASVQNTGSGGAGAGHMIGWIFSHLHVRLICLTAALDNVRSTRLIDRLGFRRMGERTALRADGTTRLSHYWELTSDEWHARQGS